MRICPAVLYRLYKIHTEDPLRLLNLIYGQPPKIVWLKMGNQSKADTIKVLQDNRAAIKQVLLTDDQACIELL